MIRNLKDLAKMLCAEPATEEMIKRNVYNYTDCGAWIAIDEGGIRLGSIVEGSDVEIEADYLAYPFTEAQYRQAEAWVEAEAEAAWNEANPEVDWQSNVEAARDTDRDYNQ